MADNSQEVELLTTFMTRPCAIEDVRLFNGTGSAGRPTATADILRVVIFADRVTPVFDAITDARVLCRSCQVHDRFDGEMLHRWLPTA